jgi:hypothetical protein
VNKGGFKVWCLVCLPDALIAVPLRPFASLLTSLVAPLRLSSPGGLDLPARYRAEIAQAPEHLLRARPGHIAYPVADLASIAFAEPRISRTSVLNRTVTLKGPGLAGPKPMDSSREIRLRGQGQQGATTFSLSNPWDFPESSRQLQRLYPGLCRTER